MTSVLETQNLGKRYGRQWGLRDCTLQIPAGSVAGLVGLNGAGKTTLMHLAAGLMEPSSGHIQVLGETPSQISTSFLTRISFVAQERPLYRYFSVKDMLTLGSKLNAQWDDQLARELLERLKIPLRSLVGKLSGGQQAQVALVLALAKRPQLLLLDEPFANVDPLARREFTKIVLETVASHEMTVLLSSNILEDLETICDYLIILSAACVQIAGDVETLLATHKWLIGPYDQSEPITRTHVVLQSSHRGHQSHLLVRINGPISHPSWQVQDVTLKEIVLAYLDLPSEDIQEQHESKQEVVK